MQIIKNPERRNWPQLFERPSSKDASVIISVQNIINEVKEDGDKALKRLTENFDGILLEKFQVSEEVGCLPPSPTIGISAASSTAYPCVTQKIGEP